MSLNPFADAPVMGLLASTETLNPGGFVLVNGTPTILTWTAPADGKIHRFAVYAGLDVTVAETGGQINVTYPLPSGTLGQRALFSANSGTGEANPTNNFQRILESGGTVTILQSTALTLGAAKMWAEIWGS